MCWLEYFYAKYLPGIIFTKKLNREVKACIILRMEPPASENQSFYAFSKGFPWKTLRDFVSYLSLASVKSITFCAVYSQYESSSDQMKRVAECWWR